MMGIYLNLNFRHSQDIMQKNKEVIKVDTILDMNNDSCLWVLSLSEAISP